MRLRERGKGEGGGGGCMMRLGWCWLVAVSMYACVVSYVDVCVSSIVY